MYKKEDKKFRSMGQLPSLNSSYKQSSVNSDTISPGGGGMQSKFRNRNTQKMKIQQIEINNDESYNPILHSSAKKDDSPLIHLKPKAANIFIEEDEIESPWQALKQ